MPALVDAWIIFASPLLSLYFISMIAIQVARERARKREKLFTVHTDALVFFRRRRREENVNSSRDKVKVMYT